MRCANAMSGASMTRIGAGKLAPVYSAGGGAPEWRPTRCGRDNLRYPSDLTDAEWEPIEPLIPPAGAECFDIFSPESGDSNVMGRLSFNLPRRIFPGGFRPLPEHHAECPVSKPTGRSANDKERPVMIVEAIFSSNSVMLWRDRRSFARPPRAGSLAAA